MNYSAGQEIRLTENIANYNVQPLTFKCISNLPKYNESIIGKGYLYSGPI